MMVSPATPEIRKRGNVTVIMFGPQFETLDGFAVDQVREFVLEAAKSATPPNVVIDLSHTKYVGSSFIEVLFRVCNQVNGAGGNFALTGVTSYFREVLEITHLDKLWMTEWVFDEDSDCSLCIRISEPAPGTEDWMIDVGVVFADDPSVLVHVGGPAFSKLSDRRQSAANTTQNEHLRLVEGLWKPLQAFEWTTEKKPVTIADVVELIETSAMKLRTKGINLQLPASLENLPKVGRVDVRCLLSEDAVQKTASLSVNVLLSARLEFAVDDQTLTIADLEQMAKLKQPLVKLRGKWVYFDPAKYDTEELRRLAQRVQDRAIEPDASEALICEVLSSDVDSESISISTDHRVQEFIDRLTQPEKFPMAALPRGLNAELRHYQQFGYSWLAFLSDHRLGACLADDMGLGKTLQTLAWLLRSKQQGNERPSLLICPTSLMRNWQHEMKKFAPSLRWDEHHGPNRCDRASDLSARVRNCDVVITTYNVLSRDATILNSVAWQAVILDEAQNIKNHETKQSRAVCDPALSKDCSFRLALTGTPIENHIDDLWPIMHFLNPGLLGTYAEFKSRFASGIRSERGADALARLKKTIKPFILRRMKSDPKIVPDLPEKLEATVWCSLTRRQAEFYRASLNELEQNLTPQNRQWGAVLKAITELKQTCNHPALLMKDRSELMSDSSELDDLSGKVRRLVEMLEQVLDNDEKALIFTQYAAMAKMLSKFLSARFGILANSLTGESKTDERDILVQTFQTDVTSPILILTPKAGGVGLNLTAATHVFHFDRWWNPAVEDQATDRAYRIGQTKSVNVHKFVCVGTLEERIAQMLDEKRSLSTGLLSDASDDSLAAYLCKLNDDERRSFLRLDDEAVCDD